MPGALLQLVEDDHVIGHSLVRALEAQGYRVRWSSTGAPVVAGLDPDTDLVLLDLGLPDIDGFELCRQLRAARPELDIVMLTARQAEVDIVLGLDCGADDYIIKPFRLAELLARIRARLRRQDDEGGCVSVGVLSMDLTARRVRVGDVELELRRKEFDLLALLAREAGRVVLRERIMEEVWDEHWFGSTKTLDIHISALRRKLDQPGMADQITTVRGVGYRFERR